MEEARHDVPMRREFAGLDAAEDATTFLKFRRLLEAHALFDETAAWLAEPGLRLRLRPGTMVDATRIAASPATQHRDRPHDPERSSTKKGRHDDFGLKAPIGVDADSGLVHTVEVTTAKVADGVMTGVLLHGEETVVLGDRAYTRNDRNLAAEREGHDPVWAFPFQRKPGEAARPAEQALINRRRAPPCRLVKRPFGHVKVRYRGLSKNAQ